MNSAVTSPTCQGTVIVAHAMCIPMCHYAKKSFGCYRWLWVVVANDGAMAEVEQWVHVMMDHQQLMAVKQSLLMKVSRWWFQAAVC